jgi:hypothetical protein
MVGCVVTLWMDVVEARDWGRFLVLAAARAADMSSKTRLELRLIIEKKSGVVVEA